MENLTDRQAADAVRDRLAWKYALSLELADAGFDHTVLSEFRSRLAEGSVEQRLAGCCSMRSRSHPLRTLSKTLPAIITLGSIWEQQFESREQGGQWRSEPALPAAQLIN